MPPELDVATNPMIVYGMVAIFVLAIALALVFAWPRRGVGAVHRSEVPDHAPGGPPWMPGGDISGRDRQPEPQVPAAVDPWHQPAADQWPQPAADPWQQPAGDQWPQPVADPWQQPADDQWPAADPWRAGPPTAPPAAPPAGGQPPLHDRWSTGATGNADPRPPWEKR